MKKFIKTLSIGLISLLLCIGSVSAASIFFPYQGGTGTSTAPTTDQILFGNDSGIYDIKTLIGGAGVDISTSTSNVIFSIGTGITILENLLVGGTATTTTLCFDDDTCMTTASVTGSGTVTSVDMSVPTGLIIAGNPITTSGTLALGIDSGYQMLTDVASTTWDSIVSFPGFTDLSTDYGFTDNSSNWNTAFGWGNHTGLYDILGQATSTKDWLLTQDNTWTGAGDTTFAGNIGIGTTSPAYALDVQGSIQTDTAFYGDYWISSTENSMNIQPTGDTDDFFSFKTPADRPTIKREGGKYIYFESSNVNDVGISFRKDADHSGTINYYKDENLFGLTSKDPLVFKVCGDYDNYVTICTADNIPELSVASSSGFKINAGGTNDLLLNHDGGNIGIGTTSPAYKLDVYGNSRIDGTLTVSGNITGGNLSGSNTGDQDISAYMQDTDIDTFAKLQSWAVGYVDNDTTYTSSDWTLSDITGYVANEHLDWTSDLGAVNINAGNYTDTNTTYLGGTGLTLDGTTFNVNTSQNIATLSNLTDNGFVKTSGGNGTLSIDTSTYLTGNQSITLSGDVSGSGATSITTTIGADKILETMLKAVNEPTDEYVLTYESTTGDFEWQASAGGGDVTKVGTPVDNQVGVWTGDGTIEGTNSLFFNGNLGIGTTSPTYLLDISPSVGTATNDLLRVATSTGEGLYITNDGRIGINTDDPASLNQFSGFLMAQNSGAKSDFGNVLAHDGSDYPSFYLSRSRGTLDSPTIVVVGNKLGNLSFNGYDGFDYETVGASIHATVIGTPASNDIKADLKLFSTGGSIILDDDFTVLDTGNITMTGSLGVTGTRITKGWFTDLEVTNAIAGSITGNSATVTGLTLNSEVLTLNTGALTLTPNADDSSVLTIGAGAVSVSGSNTGDQDLSGKANIDQTMYIGTTGVAINRGSGALTLAGLTLTTPNLGTPSALVGTNISGTGASFTAGAVTGFTPASGSLTLAGADALTLTTSAATNVTLPTSGTLITNGVTTLNSLTSATSLATLSALTSVGTIGTGTWEGTAVDFSSYTNATGGRSVTLNGDAIDVDLELYTDEKGVYIESPVVESLNDLIWFMNNITITYVWCKTDTGTVTMNIEDGSDNNILSSELVCDAGGQTSCASGCDVNTINTSYDNITAKTEDIDYDASAVASDPTKLSLQIGYTIDD